MRISKKEKINSKYRNHVYICGQGGRQTLHRQPLGGERSPVLAKQCHYAAGRTKRETSLLWELSSGSRF